MPKIICIEGLIGAGKSTLIDSLWDEASFKVVHEPVEDYAKFANYNPLKLQYESSAYGDTGLVQMHIIGVLERQWMRILFNCSPNQIIISDRSLYSPNVFSMAMHSQRRISKFAYEFLVAQVHDSIHKVGLKDFAADKLFFLDTSPEECLVRIKNRARKEEICCDIQYLQALNEAMVNYVGRFRQRQGAANVKIVKSGSIPFIKQQLIEFAKQ